MTWEPSSAFQVCGNETVFQPLTEGASVSASTHWNSQLPFTGMTILGDSTAPTTTATPSTTHHKADKHLFHKARDRRDLRAPVRDRLRPIDYYLSALGRYTGQFDSAPHPFGNALFHEGRPSTHGTARTIPSGPMANIRSPPALLPNG